jgi:signal peptidase I
MRPGAWPGRRASQQREAPLGMLAYAGLVAVLVVLAATLAATAAPVAAGYRPVVVHGGSMGDSIPNGSLVMARWVNAGEVDVGDVILIQETGSGGAAAPKLHRVVSLEADGGNILARTKGDASPAADPPLYVLPDRVLTPAYHIPSLGFVLARVTTAEGWLLFIALPGTLLCLLTLQSIWFPAPRGALSAALRSR